MKICALLFNLLVLCLLLLSPPVIKADKIRAENPTQSYIATFTTPELSATDKTVEWTFVGQPGFRSARTVFSVTDYFTVQDYSAVQNGLACALGDCNHYFPGTSYPYLFISTITIDVLHGHLSKKLDLAIDELTDLGGEQQGGSINGLCPIGVCYNIGEALDYQATLGPHGSGSLFLIGPAALPSPVPEPETYALLGMGILVLVVGSNAKRVRARWTAH